jgi:hypothetical protein
MLEIDSELIGELPALVQIRSLWSFKEENQSNRSSAP